MGWPVLFCYFEKLFFRKRSPYTLGGTQFPCSTLENHVWLHVPSIFTSKWIKTNYHIEFEKNEDCMTE